MRDQRSFVGVAQLASRRRATRIATTTIDCTMFATTIDQPPQPSAASGNAVAVNDELAERQRHARRRKFICCVRMRSGIAPSRRMNTASAMPGTYAAARGASKSGVSRPPNSATSAEREDAEHEVERPSRATSTSRASAPRPLTTVYWPKPQIVSQFAVIAMIAASETSPIVFGRQEPRDDERADDADRAPAHAREIVHSAPRAALCASDISCASAARVCTTRTQVLRTIDSGAYRRGGA